jgi:hypothetical protein
MISNQLDTFYGNGVGMDIKFEHVSITGSRRPFGVMYTTNPAQLNWADCGMVVVKLISNELTNHKVNKFTNWCIINGYHSDSSQSEDNAIKFSKMSSTIGFKNSDEADEFRTKFKKWIV